MKATAKQLQALHAVLYKQNLLQHKPHIIEGATNGRSSSSKDLSFTEALELLQQLNAGQQAISQTSPMMSKLFAMAFEMGWITSTAVADSAGNIKQKKNYQAVHTWVEKFGYLKKPLRQYTYNELTKLVTQFELGPYKDFISKPKRAV